VISGQKQYESPQEAAIRAQRAAALGKGQEKKLEKDAANRESRWQAYSQFDSKPQNGASPSPGVGGSSPAAAPAAASPAAAAGPPVHVGISCGSCSVTPIVGVRYHCATCGPPAGQRGGFDLCQQCEERGAVQRHTAGHQWEVHIHPMQQAASQQSPARSDIKLTPYFQQQMQYLLGKVRAMPPTTVALLRKIIGTHSTTLCLVRSCPFFLAFFSLLSPVLLSCCLSPGNVLRGGLHPSEDDAKFRRIKLSNPKIQSAVMATDGALHLLAAVGFALRDNKDTGEQMLVFDNQPLDIAQLAFDEMAAFAQNSPPA